MTLFRSGQMTPILNLCAALTLAFAPAVALAKSAPQPAKSLPKSFFTGRWYEIARTSNVRQKDCEAPTYEFKAKTGDSAPFVLTCRKGSPVGKAETLNVSIKLPTDAAGNKFRVSALGGVLSTEYWVLDRAEDMSWAIMATAGGGYVWLLARQPGMDAAAKAHALARVKALGYDMSKIEQPKQS